MNHPVPKFILQPLIENSILHGIYSDMAAGVIDVTAVGVGTTLLLTVADNGAGIAADQLLEIRQVINSASFSRENAGGKYLALNNINKRLVLEYGPDSALQIESVPGQGTTVKILIPALGAPAPKPVGRRS